MSNNLVVSTSFGNFEYGYTENNIFVYTKSSPVAITNVPYWDKDAVVKAIEDNIERINKANRIENTTQEVNTENVSEIIESIKEFANNKISDNKAKGFITSRLTQIENKLKEINSK